MMEKNYIPRVVIAGRPNVGKSTLFNRLLGRRRAITDPTPGVTRDVIQEKCVLGGIPVILTDTGGVKAEYDDVFDDLVSRRSVDFLKDADVILFLVQLGEYTSEDAQLTDVLRRYSDRVILVVNKSDIPEKDYLASEFHSLGLGEPVPISSSHGRNIPGLVEAVHNKLEAAGPVRDLDAEDDLSEDELVVVLVGRPNAGKSTLSNFLVGADNSIVSDIPGTTRDTVSANTVSRGRRLRIVDTAGMRRKSKVAENVEYYSVNRAINAMLEADITVLLVDRNDGLCEQDKKITAQAVKKGRTVVIALNKWDELNSSSREVKKAIDKLRFQFPIMDWAPIVPVSAIKGYGVPKLLDVIFEAERQQNLRIETAELNRALMDWVDFTPPPTKNGRPFRVKYITQVSVKPARFIAFVNRLAGFPDSYRRFLVNQIRKEFGFELVPVELELREQSKRRK